MNYDELFAILRDAETFLRAARALLCCDCIPVAAGNIEVAAQKIERVQKILSKKEEKQ